MAPRLIVKLRSDETRHRIGFDLILNFNRATAHFAIFNIALAADREIEHARNGFPAIGTGIEMFVDKTHAFLGSTLNRENW